MRMVVFRRAGHRADGATMVLRLRVGRTSLTCICGCQADRILSRTFLPCALDCLAAPLLHGC